jgi:hypothetical protein
MRDCIEAIAVRDAQLIAGFPWAVESHDVALRP